MPRAIRLIRSILAAIGMVAMLAVAIAAGLVWLSGPDTRNATIAGLSAPVEITLDQDDVPRIHAANALDGAAALGFVHARERLFQMELMRRAASGRLSEIAGAVTLPIDRQMRVLGLRVRALEDLDRLDPATRAMLDAYARGVNAWIAARGRFAAPEFLPLGAPEPWSAVDSLLWGKTMGLWLSGNYRTELGRLALAGKLPQAEIDALWPADRQAGQPDAHAALDPRFAEAAAALNRTLPVFPAPFTLPSSASNAWAVDRNHTATGAPMLAGDPHLQFGLPGIWYLARIETPRGVLAGATAPGVPFLVLGHNGRIAWSFTTTGADTQDVFIETPAGDGQYATPGGPRPFTVREERIRVRGQTDEVLRVRETRHGPVISDLTDPRGPILAVAMANLQPGDAAAAGLLALNEAADVEAAGRAAAGITAPVQNLIVADRQRIAFFVTGRVPVRRAGDGAAPVQGADGAHDWVGWASGEALPHVVAPASGVLANANERVAPADFPVFLGRDWFGGWRADRIRALLAATDRHTLADFAAMQTDARSGYARQILPALRAVPPPDDETGRKAAALLKDWDGTMAMDLPQPLILNAWMQRFYAALLAKLGVMQPGVAPMAEFVAAALAPEGAHWCGGDCTPLLRDTFAKSTADLATRFGADPAAWRWGEPHQAVFAHPLLRAIPLLGPFATARIPAPGDDGTLDRGTPATGSFESVHGASFRGLYDLGNLDQSRFVVAPGQSGYPFGERARNFLQRWRDGDTISLGPQPGAVTATIRLTP